MRDMAISTPIFYNLVAVGERNDYSLKSLEALPGIAMSGQYNLTSQSHSSGTSEGWIRTLDSLKQLCEEGLMEEALDIMEQRGIWISRNNAYSILQEYKGRKDLEPGRRMQLLMLHCGLDSCARLCDHLIRLFACCRCLVEANQVINRVLLPSIYTWSATVSAHANYGEAETALNLYHVIELSSMTRDKYVYLAALKACILTLSLNQGRLIHQQIISKGFESDIFMGSTLVDMYAKCGSLGEARQVFDALPRKNVVSWGAMISGYAQHGEGLLALECFDSMRFAGIKPDRVAYSSILKGCSSMGAIRTGRHIHEEIVKIGLSFDLVMGSILVDMYAKWGHLEDARKVFEGLPNQDVVLWSSMISGYAQHGEGLLALECFERMQSEGVKPNLVTFSSILKACGSIGAVQSGKFIHDQILQSGLELDIVLGNTLVDMYARCGSMEEACKVFNKMPNHDVMTWGAMIAGYAQLGNAELAVGCFEDMQKVGIKPDELIFTGILSVCSRAGLVDEGRGHMKSMKECYDITPNAIHSNCAVDLLGRAGLFKEAQELLQDSLQPNIRGWRTLLSACRMHGNRELGRHCFNEIFSLDSDSAVGYVLMSNIYADIYMEDGIAAEDELDEYSVLEEDEGVF